MLTSPKQIPSLGRFLLGSIGFFILLTLIGSFLPYRLSSKAHTKVAQVVVDSDFTRKVTIDTKSADSLAMYRALMSISTSPDLPSRLLTPTNYRKLSDSVYSVTFKTRGGDSILARIRLADAGPSYIFIASAMTSVGATAVGNVISSYLENLRQAASAQVPPAPVVTAKKSEPAADGQCHGTTKKGYRCSRRVSGGALYCWQHGG